MTISASVPLIVAAVGGILYAINSPPKVAELGRLSFAVGLLAMLLHH